jgi:predicted HTH transcriptional regulator
LKTIVGFLNAKGGTLFIGVCDDTSISGIDAEINAFHSRSTDKFLLYLKDVIVSRIGKGMLGNIATSLHKVEGKRIVVIEVKKASEPCFLKPDDIFYVRTSPATEQLTGKDLLDYIKNNF